MRLFEVVDNGMFMSVNFSERTKDNLVNLGKILKLEKSTSRDQFHSTIMYSKKTVDLPLITHDEIIDPNSYSWELFGDDEDVLVLKYDSPALTARFNAAMDLGATYDYDEYKPHVTLAIDVKDIDLANLSLPTFSLELAEEKQRPLNDDWRETFDD